MPNPLLSQADLPAFDLIRPEHIEPAISGLLAANRARIDELAETSQPTFANVVEPFEELGHCLGRAW